MVSLDQKILFITSRNVINPGGELQLIKSRAKVIKEKWGIVTDFVAISRKSRDLGQKEEIGNSKIKVFKYSLFNVISIIANYYKLRSYIREQLKQNDYRAIIISGMIVLSLVKSIKRDYPNLKIISDIHGANEELIEFNKGSFIKKIFNNLLYIFTKYEQKTFLPYYDKHLVVSLALQAHIMDNSNINVNDFFIVPCTINHKVDESNYLSNRIKERQLLKLKETDILFIYSGGNSPWQSIPEMVDLFDKIRKKWKKSNMYFLILSYSYKLKQDHKYVFVKSVSSEVLKNTMCAGDFAFLLRDDFITNNVAFPNKFMEYVASGMKIITTPFIHDINTILENNNFGLILNQNNTKAISQVICYLEKEKEKDWKKIKELVDNVSFENTLNPLIKYIY